MRFWLLVVWLVLAGMPLVGSAQTGEAGRADCTIRGSGQPVPRFMSLKADEANMRAGPGLHFPIEFVYRRQGFPMKVVCEFDDWRQVIDHQNTRGWMHASLLSAKRMAMVLRDDSPIRKSAAITSPAIAQAEAGVVAEVLECEVAWCRVAVADLRGWMLKTDVWGMLPEEEF